MPICVRLDKETEELLDRTAKRLKTTKSKVVKQSIRQYCEPIVKKKTINHSEFIRQLIKDHPDSGRGDLSIRHEELMLGMLLEKKFTGRL